MRFICYKKTGVQAISLLLALLSSKVEGFCSPSWRTLPAAACATSESHSSVVSTALGMGTIEDGALSSRRSWLSGAGVASSVLLAQATFPAFASAADKLETFEDPNLNFRIKVPSNWEKQVQTLPDRRKIVLFVDPASGGDKSLLFFAFTPVRDDFTSLGSFGSVDQVAQMTILPKGDLAGAENTSEMIKAESKNNAYFFDYKAETPGQPLTHFRTIFSLAPVTGSAGATLVTLTAQAPESSYSTLQPMFDEIMDSYGKLK